MIVPMPLKLYNSLTKKEEVFSVEGDTVTMYTCGPTVYGRPHIGNYSSFLMADLLVRWLKTGHGYDVKQVKNITDVGHLVKDADSGEDKIEKQAREEHGSVTHESVINVARTYEAQYVEDEKILNMLEPFARPRASAYVEQMKEMIEILLKEKMAYATEDGIYFDVTKFPQYGALSGNTLENISAGARVEVNEAKKHPADFALWKFCVGHNEHHALRWPSPTLPEQSRRSLGGALAKPDVAGFPGWHIECSAMSRELLGDTIDIHTGGEDNIFPHHECEIAQSESVTHKPFVRYWLHKRRIDLAGEKMSKSLGNVLTIPSILAKGYDAQDLRYYLLSVHYRTNLKFSWKGMDDARKARRKIVDFIVAVEKKEKEVMGSGMRETPPSVMTPDVLWGLRKFHEAMDDDLNTSAALAVIFDVITKFHVKEKEIFSQDDIRSLADFVQCIGETFGCFTPDEHQEISKEVAELLKAREQARAAKNFAESDRLRDEILGLGYEVKDGKDGQVLRKS